MALATNLMGLGMSAGLARLVGNEPSAKTGATTALATGTAITTNFTVTTTSGGSTAFVLPSVAAGTGPLVITNPSATTALIFPNTSSETINGGSAGASVNLAQNKTSLFYKTSSTAWVSVLTA